MIVARRVLAVLLGIVFIIVTVSSALVLRVKETALNDDFYVSRLREADAYNFLYDTVLPLAFDEMAKEDLGDLSADIPKLKPHAIAALKQALPPAWLQQQAEGAIHEIVPYAAGSADTFAVQVPLEDRVRAAAEALKKAIHDSQFVDLLFADVVAPAVRDALKESSAIPFGVPVSADDLVGSARRIAPNEWLEAQLFKAIDAVVPYLVAEQDSFALRIPVSDRLPAARAEVQTILAKANLREFIFTNIIDPAVRAQIGNNLAVPFGLSVTSADVQDILRQVLTDQWFNQQTSAFVDVTVDYLSGKTSTFSFTVPLAGLKSQAVTSVGQVMDSKLSTVYDRSPVCTVEQAQRLDLGQFARTGILCRPQGISFTDLKRLAGVADYQREVAALVERSLPSEFGFSEAALRSSLGVSQWTRVQDMRKLMVEGFTFTSADLEKLLAKSDYPSGAAVPFDKLSPTAQAEAVSRSEAVKLLRDVREQIKKGASFTQADLRERMEESEPGSFESFDGVRQGLRMAGRLAILGWIVPAVLLIGIALLGGRTIATKVLWGGAFLLAAGLILFIAAGPAYGSVSQNLHAGIEQAFDDARGPGDRTALEGAVIDKGKEIVIATVDAFISGVARRGLFLTAIALAAIGGAAAWMVLEKRRSTVPVARPAEPA